MAQLIQYNRRKPKVCVQHARMDKWVLLVLMPILMAFDSKPAIRHFSQVTTYHFVAYRNDKEIGWLKASKSQQHQRQIMGMEMQLNFSLLVEFEAKASTLNEFAGQQLHTATAFRTLDREVKLDNAISWLGSQYHMVSQKEAIHWRAPIHHTVTSLYFTEPKGVDEVFSEVYLQYLKVEAIAPGTYETKLPKGGKMTYTYSGGKLTRIKSQTQYGQVIFERRNP